MFTMQRTKFNPWKKNQSSYQNVYHHLLPRRKNIFLKLAFADNGILTGSLNPFENNYGYSKNFNGIYIEEECKLRICFAIDWNDPNLASDAVTYYSGEIFNYIDENHCLVLRWLLMRNGLTKTAPPPAETHIDVLFDKCAKNHSSEIKKILQSFPKNIFT